MTTRTSLNDLINNIDWTNEPIRRPREIEGVFYLTVKTKYRDMAEFNRYDREAREEGLNFLIDYFWFVRDETYIECALDKEPYVTTPRWHMPVAPGGRLVFEVAIEKEPFFAQFSKKTKPLPEEGPLTMKFASSADFRRFTKRVVDRLDYMEDNLPEFLEGGFVDYPSIVGQSFSLEAGVGDIVTFGLGQDKTNILRFSADIDEVVLENGVYRKSSFRRGELGIGITETYEVTRIASDGVPAVIGFSSFKDQDYVKERRMTSFLYNVYRDQETFFDRSTSWKVIFSKFFFPPISYSAFFDSHLGRIKRGFDDMADAILPEEAQAAISSTYGTAVDNGSIDVGAKIELRERREGEAIFSGDNIYKDIDIIPPTLSTIEDCFEEFLDKLDPKDILETLIACLPFPDFELPTINWPDFNFPKIPTINILIFIRINLDEILEQIIKRLLQLIIDFLIGLLMRLCEALMEPWGDNPRVGQVVDLETVYPDRDINFSDAAAPMGKNSQPEGSKLEDFARDLFARLTPVQICNLLRGIADQATLEVAHNLVEDEYDDLSDFFASDQDIIKFFRNIGVVIGDVALFRICSIKGAPPSDPCSAEEALESVYRNMIEIRRLRGEDIPEEFVDQIVDNYASLRESFNEAINTLADSENFLEAIREDISQRFYDVVPSEALPEDVKFASENVVVDTYGVVNGVFRREAGAFWQNIADLTVEVPENTSEPVVDKRVGLRSRYSESELPNSDAWRAIGNTVLGGPVFSGLLQSDPAQIGFFPNLQNAMSDLVDNQELLENFGVKSLEEQTISRVRGVSLGSINESLQRGYSPLEENMALGFLGYLANVELFHMLARAIVYSSTVRASQFAYSTPFQDSLRGKVEARVEYPLDFLTCDTPLEDFLMQNSVAAVSFFEDLMGRVSAPQLTFDNISAATPVLPAELSSIAGQFAIYSMEAFDDVIDADGKFDSYLSITRDQCAAVMNGALRVING